MSNLRDSRERDEIVARVRRMLEAGTCTAAEVPPLVRAGLLMEQIRAAHTRGDMVRLGDSLASDRQPWKR